MRKHAQVLLIFCQLLSACSGALAAPTPTQTAPPTATATPVPPIALVGGSVPCYADVTTEAEVLATVEIGDEVQIFGKARGGEFLAVQAQDLDGFCWLPSDYVTVLGSTEHLPRLVPTPLPPPDPPRNFVGTTDCRIRPRRAYESSIFAILTWEDVQGETGYRIFRGDTKVADLPAGAVYYEEVIEPLTRVYTAGVVVYSLSAYSDSGDSGWVTVSIEYGCSILRR